MKVISLIGRVVLQINNSMLLRKKQTMQQSLDKVKSEGLLSMSNIKFCPVDDHAKSNQWQKSEIKGL